MHGSRERFYPRAVLNWHEPYWTYNVVRCRSNQSIKQAIRQRDASDADCIVCENTKALLTFHDDTHEGWNVVCTGVVSLLHTVYTSRWVRQRLDTDKKLVRRWDSGRELFTTTSSTTFTQCVPEATEFGEITQNKGHYAVQGHSRSPILVPIESSCTTSYYN